MLQLARREDHFVIESLSQHLHCLRVSWRPDLYKYVEQLYTTECFDELVSKKQLYVAKIGNNVVGYVRILFHHQDVPGTVNRKIAVLEEIVVCADYRNMGLGTQMMDDVKALAKAFGCNAMHLGVYPQNDEAVAFFQKNGLTIRSIEMQMSL